MKKNRRGMGFFLLIIGIVFFILGFWLFTRILGIQLLFMEPVWGQLCKYFWILLLGGIACSFIGQVVIKKNPKEEKEQRQQTVIPENTESEEKMDIAISNQTQVLQDGVVVCPKCGKNCKAGSSFCTACGCKL